MTRATTSFVCCVLMTALHGQNLVPNWSFEDHLQCPTLFNQIELASGWMKSLTNNVAPHHVDYMHTCGTGNFQAPDCFWGYQAPATGQAFAAISTRSPLAPDYRENIHAQLIEPLTPGGYYTLSMRISHTDLSAGATNNLGIRLSTTSSFPIDNFSHVHSTSVITDHVNWITLIGDIIADSAYSFVGVGNFHTDANTTTTTVCPSCPYVHNEYYIDDICILPHSQNGDPVFCDIPHVPATTSLGPVNGRLPATVTPTLLGPDERTIRISAGTGGSFAIHVTDGAGRILQRRMANDDALLDMGALANGTYIIHVSDEEGRTHTARFVVAR